MIWTWFIWIIIGVDPTTMGYPSLGAQMSQAFQAERAQLVEMAPIRHRGR
jgi:hypothetical protein